MQTDIETKILQYNDELIIDCEKLLKENNYVKEHILNLICDISKKYSIPIYDLYRLYCPTMINEINSIDDNLYLKINDEFIQIKME